MTMSTRWSAQSKDYALRTRTVVLVSVTDEVRNEHHWGPGAVAMIEIEGVPVALSVRELEELSTAAERLARDNSLYR